MLQNGINLLRIYVDIQQQSLNIREGLIIREIKEMVNISIFAKTVLGYMRSLFSKKYFFTK